MNLIDTLQGEVNKGSTLNSISQKLGISQNEAAAGIHTMVPAILAGILRKSATGGTLGNLSSIFTGNALPVDTDPEVELHHESTLLDRGKELIQSLFGSEEGQVNHAVSQSSGLSTEKSSSLMVMAVPLITGYVGNVIARENWSIPEFLQKLFHQKDDIQQALPSNLTSSLGVSSLNLPGIDPTEIHKTAVESDVQPAIDTTIPPMETTISPTETLSPDDTLSPEENIVPPVENQVPPIEKTVPQASLVPEPKSASGSILKWVIIVVLLILIAWYFMGQKGCHSDLATAPTTDTLAAKGDTLLENLKDDAQNIGTALTGALNEAGDWVYDLGTGTTIDLPIGASLEVGEHSVEKRLVQFIESNSSATESKWFSLDRLYFETGKSVLKPESEQQLKNIAAILEAYPNVHLKIGGYTDNTGSPEVNKKVSTERAAVAMQMLVDQGISADRLEAEGYGSDHPVANNDTPEGRAQNRRIDVKVTAK